MATASRFWVFWIKNTMRKVTMVVPVLMTSCHVSEKWKMGPVTAQPRMTSTRQDEGPRRAHTARRHVGELAKELARRAQGAQIALGRIAAIRLG